MPKVRLKGKSALTVSDAVDTKITGGVDVNLARQFATRGSLSESIIDDSGQVMSIAAGSLLGPYQILTLLGAGGMGEVWKARDTRLGRFVAIKQLTAAHAGGFLAEARAITALNHPHICQIHDIGPDYLVLEYIDGQPLEGPYRWRRRAASRSGQTARLRHRETADR